MPPQANVNRAMTVSGPPSASTPREYEESGGSYEDRDNQPDRAASANARWGGPAMTLCAIRVKIVR